LGKIPDRQEVLLQSILMTIKVESSLVLFPNPDFYFISKVAVS